jgi:leucyl-tRNA synthetase
VWRLTVETPDDSSSRQGDPTPADVELTRSVHRLIAKVSDDMERWSFNTSVAACMEFTNELQRYRREESGVHRSTYDAAADALLLLLAPMTPHVTAEAWERRHGDGARLHAEPWPSFDPDLARAERVTMVVQVNGKLRDRIDVAPDISESDAVALALASARVVEDLGGQEPGRIVARPPRLVNIVR